MFFKIFVSLHLYNKTFLSSPSCLFAIFLRSNSYKNGSKTRERVRNESSGESWTVLYTSFSYYYIFYGFIILAFGRILIGCWIAPLLVTLDISVSNVHWFQYSSSAIFLFFSTLYTSLLLLMSIIINLFLSSFTPSSPCLPCSHLCHHHNNHLSPPFFSFLSPSPPPLHCHYCPITFLHVFLLFLFILLLTFITIEKFSFIITPILLFFVLLVFLSPGLYYDDPEITPHVQAGVYRYSPDNQPMDSFPSAVEARAVVEGQLMAKYIHAHTLGYRITPSSRILATGGAAQNNHILQASEI